MAGSAGLREMGTFQLKIGYRMVKINFTPTVARMATFTTRFLIILLIQVRLMDILMTIHACFAYLPETPLACLFMAGKTGRCQVCTLQLKPGLVMPLNGKVRPFKAQGGMAIGTIGPVAITDKLLIMVICMAVMAIFIFDRPAIPAFMAAGTGNILMFPHQRIAGPGMVEIFQLLDPPEGYFRMALNTILSEFIIVHIPVAGSTVAKLHTGKLLHFGPITERYLMAFDAFNIPMFPAQIEPGIIMFEFRSRPEYPEIMTG